MKAFLLAIFLGSAFVYASDGESVASYKAQIEQLRLQIQLLQAQGSACIANLAIAQAPQRRAEIEKEMGCLGKADWTDSGAKCRETKPE